MVVPRTRRPILSVIGNGGEISASFAASAERIGELAVDAGFRVACGGRDGVMDAVMRGAHRSARYREGDTIGILTSYECTDASGWCDIVIPTGIGYARNMVVVASGDVVVAMGGGAGTLSEIALAWQIRRPILAWVGEEGWAARLAGIRLDSRHDATIEGFDDAAALITRARALVQRDPPEALGCSEDHNHA